MVITKISSFYCFASRSLKMSKQENPSAYGFFPPPSQAPPSYAQVIIKQNIESETLE